MGMAYEIAGTFVECCDCFTVCPCWTSDIPDEDHCSGLYVWTFREGSRIEGHDVGGRSVAAASFHAVRAGGQAMLFIDSKIAGAARHATVRAFTGKAGGPLKELSKLLGTIIGWESAEITAKFEKQKFSVCVGIADHSVASASGEPKVFLADNALPMTLSDTALTRELGIEGPVQVQAMKSLTVAVAALPGGPLEFSGRWGARGRFQYAHAGDSIADEAAEAIGGEPEEADE